MPFGRLMVDTYGEVVEHVIVMPGESLSVYVISCDDTCGAISLDTLKWSEISLLPLDTVSSVVCTENSCHVSHWDELRLFVVGDRVTDDGQLVQLKDNV